jgi:protein phosphatase
VNRTRRDTDFGVRCDAGRREANEDAVLCVETSRGAMIAAVADGLGGLAGGALASRTALDALQRAVEAGRPLPEAIEDAHTAVRELAQRDAAGTTVVAALVQDDRVRIANVGDSRAYHLGPLGLVQLTRDHTVVAEARRRGDGTAREVAGTRWGSSLTRSLGSAAGVRVDEMRPLTLGPGEWIVLTSDGVHGSLEQDEMESILRHAPDAAAAAALLVERALAAGSADNLSAVVLRRSSDLTTARTRDQRWDPSALVDRSRNHRGRSSWGGPGILAWTLLVALVLLVLLLLLG